MDKFFVLGLGEPGHIVISFAAALSRLVRLEAGLVFGLASYDLEVADLLMSAQRWHPTTGLVFGQHLPDKHHQLASHRAGRFVMGFLFAQAQIESLQRAGAAHNGMSSFHQQPASVRAVLRGTGY